MYLLNPSFFSPARLADKRAPEPPSCQSPLPKAVPALGIHPSTCVPRILLQRCSISSGPTADGTSSISPFARWINQAFTMLSGSESFEARSTPRIQRCVSALSTPSRQGVYSEPSGLDRAHTRCTFAGENLTRISAFLALSVLFAFSAN